MYKAKYIQPINTLLGVKESRLVAKFKFHKDVAPKNRKEVQKRIATLLEESVQVGSPGYLANIEKFTEYNKGNGLSSPINSRYLIMNGWGLTLKLKVRSFKNINHEELFDLGALNDYIISGEIPKPSKAF